MPLHNRSSMRTFRKEKLARDKIIDHIQALGGKVSWRYLSDQEYGQALRTKLIEEAHEVLQAQSREELIQELADIFEVIDAIKQLYAINQEEIINAQDKKRESKGGFFERIYIEHASYPSGSQWEKYCLDNPDKYPEIK
jgi:predicted house-cleaning noncanonical NTP pyrophosphatase (MazG superfamily)